MITKLLKYLVLPKEMTQFERDYLNRMNRIALIFFVIHIPVFAGVALLCGTNALRAVELSLLIVAGPLIAYKTLAHPRNVSVVIGFTSMCMGGLLVHFGQGAMQIEMHFYFFVLIALLAVFANPMVIVTAAVTVALHHLVLYFVLPRSVFNYEASIWAVGIHALFVVLESIAACFVARSFFDNVIGLEKIVDRRTRELDARNRDMRLVLENVGQGFMTMDREGRLSTERSAIVETWFGPYAAGKAIWDYLGRSNEQAGNWLKMGWEAVLDDFLPTDLALEQMPKSMMVGPRTFRLDYKPIVEEEQLTNVLLVISDVTTQLERERAEADQREMLSVFEHIMSDKVGFLEFYAEASELVGQISTETDLAQIKRNIHTVKGNCGAFGMKDFAALCHSIEERIGEAEELLPSDRACLEARWKEFSSKLQRLVGEQRGTKLEIEQEEYVAILRAIAQGLPTNELTRMVEAWKLEPTAKRLGRIAEQARGIAARLNKGEIDVEIESNGLRLPTERWAKFWGAFTHVVRNALDHGLEDPVARVELGKPQKGRLGLRTFLSGGQLVVEIKDDGRGIDWKRVAVRARAAGIPSEGQDNLVDALFHDGVTTKDSVTEFSGRGVGLGAIRAACVDLGGTVRLTSEQAKGTSVQFWMPLSSMVDPRRRTSGVSLLPAAANGTRMRSTVP